jgi:protocatechuate 4,5-dioxygenase beta chain
MTADENSAKPMTDLDQRPWGTPSGRKDAVWRSARLEGERAGFINKRFDLHFLDSMESNPEWATQFSDRDLVEKAGTQGVELLNWLAMRGAVSAGGASVKKVHGNYHIPISNTATGLLALEVA